MLCKSFEDAKQRAQVNANRTGKLWGVFCDTAGNWRAEYYWSCQDVPGSVKIEPVVNS